MISQMIVSQMTTTLFMSFWANFLGFFTQRIEKPKSHSLETCLKPVLVFTLKPLPKYLMAVRKLIRCRALRQKDVLYVLIMQGKILQHFCDSLYKVPGILWRILAILLLERLNVITLGHSICGHLKCDHIKHLIKIMCHWLFFYNFIFNFYSCKN